LFLGAGGSGVGFLLVAAESRPLGAAFFTGAFFSRFGRVRGAFAVPSEMVVAVGLRDFLLRLRVRTPDVVPAVSRVGVVLDSSSEAVSSDELESDISEDCPRSARLRLLDFDVFAEDGVALERNRRGETFSLVASSALSSASVGGDEEAAAEDNLRLRELLRAEDASPLGIGERVGVITIFCFMGLDPDAVVVLKNDLGEADPEGEPFPLSKSIPLFEAPSSGCIEELCASTGSDEGTMATSSSRGITIKGVVDRSPN